MHKQYYKNIQTFYNYINVKIKTIVHFYHNKVHRSLDFWEKFEQKGYLASFPFSHKHLTAVS